MLFGPLNAHTFQSCNRSSAAHAGLSRPLEVLLFFGSKSTPNSPSPSSSSSNAPGQKNSLPPSSSDVARAPEEPKSARVPKTRQAVARVPEELTELARAPEELTAVARAPEELTELARAPVQLTAVARPPDELTELVLAPGGN